MESNPVLANCIISGNSAWRGGGLYCDYCSNPRLINCLITGNLAPTSWFEDKGHGGGIYSLDESTPMLINCTLVGNRAGYGNTLLCNTIRPNIKKSYIELLNCIIQDEGVGGQSMACSKGITINHCCVLDDWPGEGNIHANPLFVDPGYWDPNGTSENSEDDFWVDGDYRLLPDSPCIDAGDPNYVSDPNGTHLDIYGGPRLINGRLDIGADEYNPPEPSNLKSDGIINFKDFALLALNWRVDTCTQEQWFNGSDIDQNGKVEIFDLIGLMENWLEPVNWERAADTVPRAAEIKGIRRN